MLFCTPRYSLDLLSDSFIFDMDFNSTLLHSRSTLSLFLSIVRLLVHPAFVCVCVCFGISSPYFNVSLSNESCICQKKKKKKSKRKIDYFYFVKLLFLSFINGFLYCLLINFAQTHNHFYWFTFETHFDSILQCVWICSIYLFIGTAHRNFSTVFFLLFFVLCQCEMPRIKYDCMPI